MKTYYANKGKPARKQLNKWGKTLEAVLLEKKMTLDEALKLLVLNPLCARLNRSTLYRWGYISDASVPPRAHTALEIIRQRPNIDASDATIQQWMEKLARIEEQLGTMQTEVKILIAQLSFHKK